MTSTVEPTRAITRTPDSGGREIVVGLDAGPAAAEALRWAAAEAAASRLGLRVVHAWALPTFEAATASHAYIAATVADARARATQWVLDGLGGAEVEWALDIVQGAPGPALVNRSSASALLVVGTGEHTGFRRALFGSVSHYCRSHSAVPVVVVPPPVNVPGDDRPTAGTLLRAPGSLL